MCCCFAVCYRWQCFGVGSCTDCSAYFIGMSDILNVFTDPLLLAAPYASCALPLCSVSDELTKSDFVYLLIQASQLA